MQSLFDEINSLKDEIQRIKAMLSDCSELPDSKNANPFYESHLGSTAARLITYGPKSAIRPWLTSSKVQRQFTSWLGIASSGFMTGLIGGFWSFGVSALLNGVERLFKKHRSPMLDAQPIHDINNIDYTYMVPGFTRNLHTELFRGQSFRTMMRDDYFSSLSLERQIKRGVVGL